MLEKRDLIPLFFASNKPSERPIRRGRRRWVECRQASKVNTAMAAAHPQSLKQYLRALADDLPETATTEEALYHLELRRDIEAGLADSDAGRTVPHEVMLQRYGLSE